MTDSNFFNDFKSGDLFRLDGYQAVFRALDGDCVQIEDVADQGAEAWLCWNEDDGQFQNEATGNLVLVELW